MKKDMGRQLLFAAGVVVGIGLVAGLAAAIEPGQLSLPDVVKRLVVLESQVAAMEERLGILEKRFEEDSNEPPEPPKKAMIEILSPKDEDQVGVNVIVKGVVREELSGRFPVVAVHPLEGNLIWIQPLPKKVQKTPKGYEFQSRAYCGTAKEGIGEVFEIYILLPKKGALAEGDQLDELPSDVPVSPVVRVTRK